MGYIAHHAIVVHCHGWQVAEQARAKAVAIFDAHEPELTGNGMGVLVSPVVPVSINSGGSFFIGPDGSKEGWETSDAGNAARDELIAWLRGHPDYIEWVEVRFGGDDGDMRTAVTRHADDAFDPALAGNPSASLPRGGK